MKLRSFTIPRCDGFGPRLLSPKGKGFLGFRLIESSPLNKLVQPADKYTLLFFGPYFLCSFKQKEKPYPIQPTRKWKRRRRSAFFDEV